MIIILLLLLNFSLFAEIKAVEPIAFYSEEIDTLAAKLEERNIPREWLLENISREGFKLYPNVEKYFTNMSEHRVSRGEITISDYKQHFGVNRKIELGKNFIEKYRDILLEVEARNGIHFELVTAIIGMETNFAEDRQRGSFYVFDTLVTQYLLLPQRQRFAVNELAALYRFQKLIARDIEYFIGSFAGASGWGQFIPTSMEAYFLSAENKPETIDIYSVEDTLFSIENYLFEHRLNKNTISSEQHRRNAVFAYNRSEAYVQAVLFMYDEFIKLRVNRQD